MSGHCPSKPVSAVPSMRTFASSNRAWIRHNFPSFSRENDERYGTAMKIGRSGAFEVGGLVPKPGGRTRYLTGTTKKSACVNRLTVGGAGECEYNRDVRARSSFWPQEPYPKGGPPMRLITFILSSGIALTCIPACASAQSLQPAIPPGMWVPHCPMNEGDQVCARDAVPMVQESRPAPSQRAYGSLWWPSRAQKTARRPANQKPNRNR
jgi:hypothetical protein